MWSKIVTTAAKSAAVLKRFAPEIMVGAGIVGGVAAAVMACKASPKAALLKEELASDLESLQAAQEEIAQSDKAEEYTEQDARMDVVRTYAAYAGKLIRLYGPAVLVGVGAVASILGGCGILRGRVVALGAALTASDRAYDIYRSRVRDRFGEDVDNELKYGLSTSKVTVKHEDGTKEKVITQSLPEEEAVATGASQYARVFDASNPNWSPDKSVSLLFLQAQQTYMNNLLNSRGHVLLNEVYDAIGLPRTSEGCLVGWMKAPAPTIISGAKRLRTAALLAAVVTILDHISILLVRVGEVLINFELKEELTIFLKERDESAWREVRLKPLLQPRHIPLANSHKQLERGQEV